MKAINAFSFADTLKPTYKPSFVLVETHEVDVPIHQQKDTKNQFFDIVCKPPKLSSMKNSACWKFVWRQNLTWLG